VREWGLLAASVAVSVLLALGLVRWLAPGLLGVPVDLQVVQVDEAVAPFYETVFRDAGGQPGLLRDPHTVVRGRPLVPELKIQGPHDVLGFRNEGVPNRVDVVVIGDSQTYGVNTPFARTWPRRLARRLEVEGLGAGVYSMASAGWSAVQYLEMFERSRAFEPGVVVVAFYTGNDPRESFRTAYSLERWRDLRLDPSLDVGDLSPLRYPPPRSEWWEVRVGGEQVTFTPALRLLSNVDEPAPRTGWAIMAEVARRIAERCRRRGCTPVFTAIPSKELAFESRLRQEGVPLDPVYAQLVQAERRNVERLGDGIRELPGALFADLLPALQAAVLRGAPAYRRDTDGHPRSAGHAVIARTIEPVVAEALRRRAAERSHSLQAG
jgi:lysophospholipase L1-like esterase